MPDSLFPDPPKPAAQPASPHTKLVDELYGDWFLDYASYVILERAVPHINDGFKPVQRRIMHSLRELEDGRYNKVANVVGNTMKYHPHGDASIGDAMTQLGQKELLIDTQGNWGNILTGDDAAAPRYIEARLSKFALDVVFAPKVTTWAQSYDGRNKEPVTLPVKFPLLLAQGVEGIAVGLSCRILPHNFLELCDASIKALRNEAFVLYPDFPQGGIMDAADYNDGQRGGRVRVRAKIETVPRRNMLQITEMPFGTTAGSIQDSIVAANEKGKIKVQKVEDNTAEFVEIIVHLPSGTDAEQAIQALYAFTDCEVSISVNAVVIQDDKPRFISVTDLLCESAGPHEGGAQAGAGDPAQGTGGEVALLLPGEDLHREAHLPRHRRSHELGRRDRRHLEGTEALPAPAQARSDRGGRGAPHRDQDQAHLEVQLLRGG